MMVENAETDVIARKSGGMDYRKGSKWYLCTYH